ncbi:MAG: threonine-phosphate decarboxylase CobD [Bacillota bacterium]
MKQIHGGNVEEVKKIYNLSEEEIIDFSSNINFLGPPPGLKKLLSKKINEITRYPEPYSDKLEEKLAKYLEVNQKNIVIGNGGVEIIYELVKVLNFDSVLLPVPTFSEYERAVKCFNKKIKYYYLNKQNNYQLSIDRFIKKIKKNLRDIDLLIICNPNNPTGTLLHRKDLFELIKICRGNQIFLVIDEAFIDFVDNIENYTLVKLVNDYDNLFLIRSMTKFYAIPGLRLGYGIGNEKIVKKIKKNKMPWSVNIFAQIAGKEVLGKNSYYKKTRRENRKERKFLYRKLKNISGLKPLVPSANYIGIDISNLNYKSFRLADKLARSGILIRDCSTYKGINSNFIRIAVKSRKNNQLLLNNIKTITG